MTDAKTVTEPRTRTLEVPGATLTYDIREANAASDAPVLMMIGSPMGAGGFTTLAEYFQDRTVVTYDPRGVGRSEKTNGAEQSTPEEHADDLHRLIAALDGRPVDIFASSGGAVNGLVLVAEHPEQVRTLVAHEPPSAQALPDREQALAAAVDIHETYERDGIGPAMAKFIALTSLKGPIPDDFAGGPAPDPADFGLPTDDDGTRNDPLVGQNIVTGTHHEHEVCREEQDRGHTGDHAHGAAHEEQDDGEQQLTPRQRLDDEPPGERSRHTEVTEGLGRRAGRAQLADRADDEDDREDHGREGEGIGGHVAF